MTIEEQRKKIEWDLLKYLGRAYLDIQKDRVQMELRSQTMVSEHLLKKGLAKKEITIDEKTGHKGEKIVKIKSADKEENKTLKKKIKEAEIEFMQQSEVYKLMIEHKNRMHRQEKDLLKSAVKLFEDSVLWQWCIETRGLGEVAGMTFISYIDPTKTWDDKKQAYSVTKSWKYLGMTPDSKLKRGEQARFNPLLKGRFIGVIAKNVIRSNDPYYAEVYHIKKEYYQQRPDLLALKEKKPKGWLGHIDNMAIRVLIKLLVSHAYDILKFDRGLVKEIVIDHRNNIPLKPDDLIKRKDILERYRFNHAVFLEKLKLAWAHDETENKEKYAFYLRHGSLDSDIGRDLGL